MDKHYEMEGVYQRQYRKTKISTISIFFTLIVDGCLCKDLSTMEMEMEMYKLEITT